ncbi:MAG: outer membrane protein assembly factor BamD [Nitrospinota bacterium]
MKIFLNIFFILSLQFFIISCSLKEAKTDYELLNEGQKNFAKRKFDKSEELFKQLLDEHPDSKLRIYAMMGLADSLYKSNKFQEASFQYRDFYDLYPVHNNAVKSHFYKGMAEFNEVKPYDRDQTFTKNALSEFKKLTSNPDYINSPFYEESKQRLEKCRKILAENIFFIGRFYFRTSSYQSVINRMNDLLTEYPGEPFEDEAIFYIAESYYREDSFKKASEEFKKLIEKYPGSVYVTTAKSRIAEIETVRR